MDISTSTSQRMFENSNVETILCLMNLYINDFFVSSKSCTDDMFASGLNETYMALAKLEVLFLR